jgi:hypothetical protein
MSGFSLTDAALEGLRITRERPTAVLWWWAVWAIAFLTYALLLSSPSLHGMSALLAKLQTADAAWLTNPGDLAANQSVMTMTAQAAPALFAFAGLMLVAQIVVSTAVLRAVLRPAERRFGYVRVSMDEIRQAGLAAMMLAVLLAYLFVVLMALQLVLALVGAGATSMIAALAAPVVTLWALAFPVVRLSLAPAMTLADGRVSFLRGWALTKGRFASLLGAYAIAVVITFALVFAVREPIDMALRMAGGPEAPATLGDLQSLASPYVLVDFAVGSLLNALTSAILIAPMASAFKQITGRVGAPLASVPVNESSPWT